MQSDSAQRRRYRPYRLPSSLACIAYANVVDGDEALEHLAVTRYDVVVLDRDLPGVHGDEVCRRIVSGGSQSRVLMLTAASTVRDRVEGLGLGADDYLPKPYASSTRCSPSLPASAAFKNINPSI